MTATNHVYITTVISRVLFHFDMLISVLWILVVLMLMIFQAKLAIEKLQIEKMYHPFISGARSETANAIAGVSSGIPYPFCLPRPMHIL